MTVLSNKYQQIREAAENDLVTFIRLVHPHRVLGSIHEELCQWWQRSDAKSHQLVLLPRDHCKSAMLAYRVAWTITRNPSVRILYISSTSNLAEKQLGFIKQILTNPIYQRYWPEMVNPEEGKREKWTTTEISIDHPVRFAESIREPTVFTGGLTTSLTGLHCDIACLDDVVVQENAYTEEGRTKVQRQYSLLSSIEGGDAQEWVVGTRYFAKDLYDTMLSMELEDFNETGELVATDKLYEVFERVVEDQGDGFGEFLWPRTQRSDGKWFGFDSKILAKKRAQYLDKTIFRSQYYNDPNDYGSSLIKREHFNYYDPNLLTRSNGSWYIQGRKLNLFAAVDFAYSLAKRADFTSIVVIGVDANHDIYVLDIERFKTEGIISEYFAKILKLHQKWDFRKLRAETTAAQQAIVKELKDVYIRRYGLALAIEENKPTRHLGSKEERVTAALQPKYLNGQIWHYRGGGCQVLEEELIQQKPPHDDVKDTLASAVEIVVPPSHGSHTVQRSRYVNPLQRFRQRRTA